ncbi:MAG TPA: winged helix DNA-binding domain-containing protein [Ktedonobacteraceae bacterium]|jgi:hypothetical protein|nr:winged helix DNA-binding domain-containing protein [Ktedonobacteraceae bacterium]
MIDIAQHRLYNQGLAQTRFEKPGNAVEWFGAVQAQDYPGALWALGLRLPDATEADIEQALADGVFVRTHPMRGTWHFVAAADIRWLLSVTAPHNIARSATWYRRLELDDATCVKSNELIAQALQGDKQLTRREIAGVLENGGISTQGLRLTFLLHRAELDGVVVSGKRRGKQHTFALLDEVVPATKTLERDEALAELARRYFTSHGPATIQDFIWWSSLSAADARSALELARPDLIQEVIQGRTYWLALSQPCAKVASPTVHLLPSYDEYTVAYKDRSAVLDPDNVQQTSYGLLPTIVVAGRIVGTWKREIKKDEVIITLSTFIPLTGAQKAAVVAAAERYSRFVGKRLVIT